MQILDNLNRSDPILVLGDEDDKKSLEGILESFVSPLICSLGRLFNVPDNSIVNAVVLVPPQKLSSDILRKLHRVLKPEGKLLIKKLTSDLNNIEFALTTSGFMSVTSNDSFVTCKKPKFEVGSSAKLNLKQAGSNVWKLDASEDEDDIIDADELLDEDDFKKPEEFSLRVCGTTGKRKACKDCSCGLADELQTESQVGKVVETSNAQKSSCGNCYLGDAFRCASCPYLGMPAFKPGEKIQLSNIMLQSDI
ncbi:anamorsin homolog [Cylas formicarius]|uniref:anamorsin homolog n=1 Tax=Cylas formicarius TaxID=197179 RepID=UPI00295890A2|nr:anamorsin homolog [Cylas formicarius]